MPSVPRSDIGQECRPQKGIRYLLSIKLHLLTTLVLTLYQQQPFILNNSQFQLYKSTMKDEIGQATFSLAYEVVVFLKSWKCGYFLNFAKVNVR